MAKLDDLPLDPDQGPGKLSERARDFLDELSELLGDTRFNFANDTLSGIFESVERTGHVTPGQYTAVGNIRTSVADREDRPRGGSRRYEGWSR
jgi:hypothetical protein